MFNNDEGLTVATKQGLYLYNCYCQLKSAVEAYEFSDTNESDESERKERCTELLGSLDTMLRDELCLAIADGWS